MMFACLFASPRSVTTSSGSDSMRVLTHLAHEHSPRVEVHGRELVVLDIDGLEQLWGSPRDIGKRLRRMAADRELQVRVAVANTKMAALLATQGRCGVTVIPPGGEAEALSALPLAVLKKLSSAQASGPSLHRQPRTQRTAIQAADPACQEGRPPIVPCATASGSPRWTRSGWSCSSSGFSRKSVANGLISTLIYRAVTAVSRSSSTSTNDTVA